MRQRDPGQLTNLLRSPRPDPDYTLNGKSLDAVVNRLDALMMVLKSCKENVCVEPWKSLHPAGKVKTLADALGDDFDEFYRTQTKVEFEQCARGYFPDLEGPQDFNVFGEKDAKRMEEVKRSIMNHEWSLWI